MAVTRTTRVEPNTAVHSLRMPKSLRIKAEAIMAVPLAYMASERFKSKGIEKQLFSYDQPDLPKVSWYQPTRDEPSERTNLKNEGKPASTPKLMTASEEQLMFLRYNYAKRKLSLLRKKIARDGLTRAHANSTIDWNNRYEHLREYLVRTNLALVLAMAKRTRLGDIDFAEVVSEGNMALLRAVEKFNVDKGFKFSTYACRAILKAFSRISIKHSRHRTRFPVEFEPELEKSDWADTRRDNVEKDLTDELRQIVDRNLADLSDIEQTVIRQRFNWEQVKDSPMTLEQVGSVIGVTKERVRQIQNKALIKIRKLMQDGVLRPRGVLPEPAEEPSIDLSTPRMTRRMSM